MCLRRGTRATARARSRSTNPPCSGPSREVSRRTSLGVQTAHARRFSQRPREENPRARTDDHRRLSRVRGIARCRHPGGCSDDEQVRAAGVRSGQRTERRFSAGRVRAERPERLHDAAIAEPDADFGNLRRRSAPTAWRFALAAPRAP